MLGKWIAWNRQTWGEVPFVRSDVWLSDVWIYSVPSVLHLLEYIGLNSVAYDEQWVSRETCTCGAEKHHPLCTISQGKMEKLTLLIIGSLIGLCKQKLLYLWSGWYMIHCLMSWRPTWQVIKMNINEWRFSQTFIKYQQTVRYKNKWIQMNSVWPFIKHLHNYWGKFKTNAK